MALTQERKHEIMGQFQTHETDTGSADVQIAVLTEQINKLSEHLKVNQNDFASRRGLLKKIGTRKRLLNYLKRTNEDRYKSLISRLGIRG